MGPPGYQIIVPPGGLDAGRFAQLAERWERKLTWRDGVEAVSVMLRERFALRCAAR